MSDLSVEVTILPTHCLSYLLHISTCMSRTTILLLLTLLHSERPILAFLSTVGLNACGGAFMNRSHFNELSHPEKQTEFMQASIAIFSTKTKGGVHLSDRCI